MLDANTLLEELCKILLLTNQLVVEVGDATTLLKSLLHCLGSALVRQNQGHIAIEALVIIREIHLLNGRVNIRVRKRRVVIGAMADKVNAITNNLILFIPVRFYSLD